MEAGRIKNKHKHSEIQKAYMENRNSEKNTVAEKLKDKRNEQRNEHKR